LAVFAVVACEGVRSADDSTGVCSPVGGGAPNDASGRCAAIGGGSQNAASAVHTTVGGGVGNTAAVQASTVAGGERNTARGTFAAVSGGYSNLADGSGSVVGGGATNVAAGKLSTIAGGFSNNASGWGAAVAGGRRNSASRTYAAIGGGAENIASAYCATIAGGSSNRASARHSTVGGGLANHAGGIYATIGGGYGNSAAGAYSAVLGGSDNTASADHSLAAGRRAVIGAEHNGAFLFADSNDQDFDSVARDEFAARATGGVRFVTGIDRGGDPVAGVQLAPGSGSWASLSSRSAKVGVEALDVGEILRSLVKLPLARWSYAGQQSSVQHMGPMAEDFYAAFGVGDDHRHINTVDADGVALAAIQGLHREVRSKDAQIASLQAHVIELEERVSALEARAVPPGSPTLSVSAVPAAGFAISLSVALLLGGLFSRLLPGPLGDMLDSRTRP
jgi:hypothetical protein